MRKLKLALLVAITLSLPLQASDPPYWHTVGEEVPPACVRGETFACESLREACVRGQVRQVLSWAFQIARQCLGR